MLHVQQLPNRLPLVEPHVQVPCEGINAQHRHVRQVQPVELLRPTNRRHAIQGADLDEKTRAPRLRQAQDLRGLCQEEPNLAGAPERAVPICELGLLAVVVGKRSPDVVVVIPLAAVQLAVQLRKGRLPRRGDVVALKGNLRRLHAPQRPAGELPSQRLNLCLLPGQLLPQLPLLSDARPCHGPRQPRLRLGEAADLAVHRSRRRCEARRVEAQRPRGKTQPGQRRNSPPAGTRCHAVGA
mmetsp:Transcript_167596/g.538230  ORF Transcript_167596/g.538230 Transcript_167596/m.538230 type:complete len:240 (+) Transcript_167596:161-880(+)